MKSDSACGHGGRASGEKRKITYKLAQNADPPRAPSKENQGQEIPSPKKSEKSAGTEHPENKKKGISLLSSSAKRYDLSLKLGQDEEREKPPRRREENHALPKPKNEWKFVEREKRRQNEKND